MKKKVLLALSLLLVAILTIGSTLAVLTSTSSDYNTMTTGFARIDQLEYQRVVDETGKWVSTGETDDYGYIPDELEDFVQDELLLPTTTEPKWDDRDTEDGSDHQQSWGQVGAPGSNQLFDDSFTNVKDKFVFVKNTGFVNVYYRTIIAIESPEGHEAISINYNANSRFDWEYLGEEAVYTTINGTRYRLFVANYNEELTPGEVSRPSLLQLYMDKEADNEDVAAYNHEVDVLVVSQAVQTAGYATASEALIANFGNIDSMNHPWTEAGFDTVTAENGVVDVTGDVFLVNKPFYSNTTSTEDVVINGNGHSIHRTVTSEADNFNWDSTFTIPTTSDIFSSANGSKTTVNDLTFTGTTQSMMLGHYKNSTYVNYNTELNNVNVVGLEVVSFSSNIAPAVTVYGTATLNNTNIYGTKLSVLDTDPQWPVYDLAVVNYSKAILNNSRVDTVYMWYQGHIEVNAGSTIDTLYLMTHDKGIRETDYIVVNEGGKINNVVTKTGTYTYEEWLASRAG